MPIPTKITPAHRKQQFTLRDVAALAGVSLKTASRVLNDEPNVLETTAQAVRNAMRRLAYRPNEMARGLKGRRSGVIGIVAPVLSHEFVAACISSVHHSAQAAGRSIMLMLSDGDVAVEREQIRLLLRRQVEGLILLPAGASVTQELATEIGDTPTVVLDNPSATSAIPSITLANRTAAKEALDHLLGHGYQSIAIVGGKPSLYTISERVEGAREAAAAAGMPLQELLCDTEDELTADRVSALLQAASAPRAILALNSYACEQVLHAAQKLQIDIPARLAIVSFDDFRLADVIAGGITVVGQPTEEMGAAALRVLLDLQSGIPVQERLILTAPLILRGSCGTGCF